MSNTKFNDPTKIQSEFEKWWHHSGHMIDYGTEDTSELEKRQMFALAAWRAGALIGQETTEGSAND